MIYQRLLGACLVLLGSSSLSWAQGKSETLIVAGPRTPESAELEYPATEAVHEMRRNIYERLLAYEMTTNKDGVRVEDFDKLTGALAESWDVSPDSKSITFHLRQTKAGNGDAFTADIDFTARARNSGQWNRTDRAVRVVPGLPAVDPVGRQLGL